MAEVTYFVALPFVAADDGIAAGDRPNASIRSCAQKRCRASRDMWEPWPLAEREIPRLVISAMQRSSRSSVRYRTI
jgi:hypothetical protein